MTSSVNKLLQSLSETFVRENRDKYSSNANKYGKSSSSWSAEKVAKMLGVKIGNAGNIEASAVITLLGSKRVFAFGNDTMESLPQSKY